MIFLVNLAYAMELIALGLGISFLVWAYRNEGTGIAVIKVFGYIITIGAILILLCTTYYRTTYWSQGYFKSPMEPMLMTKEHDMSQPGYDTKRYNSNRMRYRHDMMQNNSDVMENDSDMMRNNPEMMQQRKQKYQNNFKQPRYNQQNQSQEEQ